MRRLALLLISSALLGPALPPQVQVTAVVTVVPGGATPVTDLTAADFIVHDDGTKREVVKADSISQVPLYVTVLMDVSKPPSGVIPPVRDMRLALSSFVSAIRANNPGAQFAYVEVAAGAVPRVGFDAKEGELEEAMGKVVTGQTSDAGVLEGVAEAARAMKDKPTIRRAIVSIDFSSPESGADRSGRVMIEEVQNAQASFWAVTVRDTRATTSRRESGLTVAANVSGGMRLTAVSATGLESMAKQVAAALSSQYLVTFTRPSGVIKELKVETTKGHKATVGVLLR